MLATFDVTTAKQFAARDEIENWVHLYLKSGDWANQPLSEGLKLQKRWWRGPLLLKLSDLSRALGPEPRMEYQVSATYWQVRITQLAQSFTNLETIPPLIVEYRQGVLSVRDGNHRYGAMQRKGWSRCWTLIWYNSEEDYLNHQPKNEEALNGRP